MSKRPYDGEGASQPGAPADNFSGFTSDGSSHSVGGGSNFGGVSGRKILNPKRLKGSGRAGSVKPLTPQPQAQVQPVLANTQGFGFTFGGGSSPAPANSNFNFGQQQSSASPFSFGQQQAPENSQASQGFNFTQVASNPFQSNNSGFGTGTQSSGFQGSIFNIQPTNQPPPSNQAPLFGSLNNNMASNQSNNIATTNIFANNQANTTENSLSKFGSQTAESEQSKPIFGFGAPGNNGNGFASGGQSTSAPSSFNNENAMTDDHQPASISFTFGSNAPQSLGLSTAPTKAATPAISSPFLFGQPAASTQGAFPPSRTDSDGAAKPALFSFAKTAADNAPASTATTNLSQPSGASLFSKAESTQPSSNNIFGATAGSPAATEGSANSNATSSISQSRNIFGGSSALQPSTTTASIFGGSAPLKQPSPSETTIPKSSDQTSAASTPLFSFKPEPSSKADSGEGFTTSQAAPSKPLFNFQTDEASNSNDSKVTKPPVFGTTPIAPSTSTSNIEQRKLPSFSFDSKAASTATLPKPTETLANTANKTENDGLFSISTTPAFAPQSTNKPSASLFNVQASSDTSKSLFSPQSSNPTNAATVTKPLFNFGASTSTSISKLEDASNASLAKPSTFGESSNSPFNFQPTAQGKSATSPIKSGFTFKSNTGPADTSATQQSQAVKPMQDEPTVVTPVKPSIGFKPSTERHQDISPNKSPFNFRSAAPKSQTNGEKISTSPVKQSFSSKPPQATSTVAIEDTKSFKLERPPKDKDIPMSFAEKWSALRTGDLPMDEAVDILLHDWILQLEIPERAFIGMDINQRDDLTWLWQQNAVDAAWDYHVKEYGQDDRNLLEVFRIVLNLKEAVDRYHHKSWTKADSLVNPRIFDERFIRQMAKRNIEAWENGLKSEIKSLKRRKADVDEDPSDEESTESTKRSKVGETGSTFAVKPPVFPAMAPKPVPNKPFARNGNSEEDIQNTVTSDEGRIPSSNLFATSTSQNNIANSQSSTFASSTPLAKTGSMAFAPASSNQESPSKVNIFPSARSLATDSKDSPQRSKTSQLFASIANKPVEPTANTAKPSKSLFDRISRDSSGTPLREEGEGDSPSAMEHQAVEEGGDDEDEDEEDGDDDEDEEDGENNNMEADDEDAEDDDDSTDESDKEKPDGVSKTSNLFTQSVSATAKAKEATFGLSGDNTWKPDSPIRFGKNISDGPTTTTPTKPITGFVPTGGMPKLSTSNSSGLNISSQTSWQAPANPFGLFKNAASKQPATMEKQSSGTPSAPKFTMPKPPPTTAADSNMIVSSQDTWKAPSNPFGLFKSASSAQSQSTSAPMVTLTAPSPQRPAKPLFDLDTSSNSKPTEPTKPLFGFTPAKKASDTESSKETTPQPGIFSNTGSTAPVKSIFSSVETNAVPKKPMFEFMKTDASNSSPAPVSNPWLEFAKGIKPSSPAPSGASVFASMTTSLNPSRASSPAMSAVSTAAGDTDADHHDEDDAPKEAQLDLGNANAGEENEEVLESVRAKAYEFYGKGDEKKDWTVRGVGELRILKNKETSKVRAVLRADQTAKVLLNAGLLSAATYNLMSAKRVNFIVASAEGVPSRWFLQVGKEDDAKKLSEIFEANKAN